MGKGPGLAAGVHGMSPHLLVEENACVGGSSLEPSSSSVSLESMLPILPSMPTTFHLVDSQCAKVARKSVDFAH